MAEQDVLEAIGKLDTRLTRVEQFLPQLATREEMHVAIKTAIDDAVTPLATREELRNEIQGARRFTQVLFEDLKDDIRMLSEHVVALSARVDARR